MTRPRYPQGCVAGSQDRGDPGAPRALWQVNGNNGNVNNDNRDNKAFSRPCRFVARPGEWKGEVPLEALYRAWRAARRNKRPSQDQLTFDARWADNLIDLQEQLKAGTWQPGPSTCFIATAPKARQIHAPAFGDRVVHHLVVPPMVSLYEPLFIHDSYANRAGKGTHAAVQRLEQFVRQVSSGQGGGWYLQLDIHNFFYSIDRRRLWAMLKPRLERGGMHPIVLQVVHALLRHPLEHHGVVYRASAREITLVPPHKRLENAAAGRGLPIGSLPSQFMSNVYMDPFDQWAKHTLKATRYLRYVDDFILVHRERAVLAEWHARIEAFLGTELGLSLKPDVRLRPLAAGIDFLGYVVFPTHTRVRRRVVQHARQALRSWGAAHVEGNVASGTPEDLRQLQAIAASYAGHFRHADAHRLAQNLAREFPWLPALTSRPLRFHPNTEGWRVSVLTEPAPRSDRGQPSHPVRMAQLQLEQQP